MVVLYDLKQFLGIREAVRNLGQICENKVNESDLCELCILQLNHQIMEAEQMNEVLYQQNDDVHPRHKRAPLEVIGSIGKSLFGILDREFADNYENKLTKSKSMKCPLQIY
ncbi:unnamed protein product [Hermetia illucens]|uniref:Uncharacterized protein n=1 Tax=Hermetia illucens TaxID=343691 RepID=A0A7R8YNR9_HERIL|nr:unnamed protein product [Hermetia illucens]